ncbi:MAG: hypothetical protein HY903_10440 [Deltaproteobacteria bacterium]|nr:hypothetical protein [Deltaproteobacteria bacterium]
MHRHLVSLFALGLCPLACNPTEEGPKGDFGTVDLAFTTGTEAYLLSVYSLPGGEAAPGGQVEFSLSKGGANATALTLGRKSSTPPTGFDRGALEARIVAEGRRRAAIDGLVADIRAGRRTLHPATPRQAGGCSPACTGNQMCFKGACTTTPELTFTDSTAVAATVIAVTSGAFKVNVVLDDNDQGNETAATGAANAFAVAATNALTLMGQSGGHSAALDRDQDGRMTVVFSSKLASMGDVVGFFEHRDFLPAADSQATGNEADILWAQVPGAESRASCTAANGCATDVITPEVAIGTLVHEYTHLVNFALRVYANGAAPADNEVLWLDEGMAHLMEDLTGYGASNIGAAAVALDEWPSATFASPTDSVAQRGQAYLVLRYLVDALGKAKGASTPAAAATSVLLHKTLLADGARGFLHPALQTFGADGLGAWLLATYATNNLEVTEVAAKSALYLSPVNGGAGQPVGFDPFGTFVDARGNELALTGPKLGDGSTDDLGDLSQPYTNSIAISGSYLFLVQGAAGGTTSITGHTEAAADFQLRAVRVR